MKDNSEEDMEKKEKKKEEEQEKRKSEETGDIENTDFKFHENFAEIKDATPLFKPSDLEQFVSQAEVPREASDRDRDKEKKEQVKYSVADYTSSKNVEWHEQELIADIDDLRRVGTLIDRGHRTEFRRDFSQDRIRAEMPELPEMRGLGASNEEIVKYADKRRDISQREFGSLDSMRRKDIKKYKREG